MKKILTQKKRADELFSKLIRQVGHCENCGKTQNLQCAHLFSRSYYTTRWNLKNAVCLCQGCHMKFTYDPIGWKLWIIDKFGKRYYESLEREAKMYLKINYPELIGALKEVYDRNGTTV